MCMDAVKYILLHLITESEFLNRKEDINLA